MRRSVVAASPHQQSREEKSEAQPETQGDGEGQENRDTPQTGERGFMDMARVSAEKRPNLCGSPDPALRALPQMTTPARSRIPPKTEVSKSDIPSGRNVAELRGARAQDLEAGNGSYDSWNYTTHERLYSTCKPASPVENFRLPCPLSKQAQGARSPQWRCVRLGSHRQLRSRICLGGAAVWV